MIELSLKLGIPTFEIENWPISVVDEYKAHNYLNKFTTKAEATRQALMVQLLWNQNNTKKSQFVPYTDLFPYLADNPEWLEHDQIKKAIKILNTLMTVEQYTDFSQKILEEISIERNKPIGEQDKFYIGRLIDLYKDCEQRIQAKELKKLNTKGETA